MPSSKRILEDCKKFVSHCKEIRKAQGMVVQGIGSRKGHHQENVAGNAKINHGGTRQKKPSKERPWTYPDAEGTFDVFITQNKNMILEEQVNEEYKKKEEEAEEAAGMHLEMDQVVDTHDSDDDASFFMACLVEEMSDGNNFFGWPLPMLSLFAWSCEAFWRKLVRNASETCTPTTSAIVYVCRFFHNSC